MDPGPGNVYFKWIAYAKQYANSPARWADVRWCDDAASGRGFAAHAGEQHCSLHRSGIKSHAAHADFGGDPMPTTRRWFRRARRTF
jgi:hypothetical protein